MLGAAFVTTAIMIVYNGWENKQRDKGARDYRLNEESEEDLGSAHPKYRYTT